MSRHSVSFATWRRDRHDRVAWAQSGHAPWRAWRFSDTAPLVALAEAHVEPAAAALTEAQVAAALWCPDDGPEGARTADAWFGWAVAAAPSVRVDAAARAMAVRVRLDALGARIESHQRQAWQDVRHGADPEADAEVATLWAGWFTGDPWTGRDAWEQRLLPHALRSFRAVCEARRLPPHVRDRVTDDLREGFFWALLGAGGDDQVPAWRELALRTLETMGDGPVLGLATHLDEAGWSRVGHCVAQRGSWADTVASWQPDRPEPLARARVVARAGQHGPTLSEELLDCHVARRVLSRWADDPLAPAWGVVTQNRGRARGRLRAVLADAPGRLLEPLLALPSLASRTQAAVRRFAWSWAWRELAADFAFDAARASSPPCLHAADALEPLDDDASAALDTWVLLVLLRGREAHLERWVRTGGTGDRDSTWARLLSDAVPDTLADDPDARGRSRTYRRLRAELSDRLPGVRRRLLPTLRTVAGLPSGRKLRASFERHIGPGWSNQVPPPRSGFPTFQRHAVALCRRWEALAADPAGFGDEALSASDDDPETP